jgi:hypothetical protein
MITQVALTLLTAGAVMVSPGLGPAPLQPATYRSPSGNWSLEVDPTSRLGSGPADYRAARGGDPVWSKHLPFTLREACIDDSGHVAGYGYDKGWNGTTPDGNFLIAVLTSSGEIAAHYEWPLGMSRALHGSPLPWVHAVVHDPEAGSVLFRLESEDEGHSFEQWRIVDLASGRWLDDYRPDVRAGFPPERRADVVNMVSVPGTGLYAISWRGSLQPEDLDAKDLSVTIARRDGATIANLDLPGELDVFSRSNGGDLWRTVRWKGTLMPARREATFFLWHPRSAQRVEYGLKPLSGDEQWLIEELAREPFEPASATTAEDPPNEAIDLPLLDRVEMTARLSPAPGPIRDLVAFGFVGPGQLQAVRCDDGEKGVFTCLLLDEQGNVLLERQLADSPVSAWWPIDGGRWLVTRSANQIFKSIDAMLVDASGVLHQDACPGFATVTAVSAAPNGGFVVLGNHYEVRSAIAQGAGTAVASYDATGSRRWLASLDGEPKAPHSLTSSDDVAVSRSGTVAVVDPWKDALGLIGDDGTFLERLELAELWDHDPSYPADIEPDGDSGFLVIENQDSPIVRRIGNDGRVRSSIVPLHPDGSKEDWITRHVRSAPDGRLWTTDGIALLRLSEDGRADLVLGQDRVVANLDHPWCAGIDPLGRIAIFDAGTRALHVFDASGQALQVDPSSPGDFEGAYGEGEILGAFDGSLYVRSSALEGGWLGFDAQGRRLGPIDLGGRTQYDCDDEAFAPAAGEYWLHGAPNREVAVLRSAEKRVLARIDRRADRRWFERLEALAVAPSGRVAVLENLPWTAPLECWSGGSAVAWFDGRGQPLGQAELSNTHTLRTVACSDEWIAAASYETGGIWLLATSSTRLKRFIPPADWNAGQGGAMGFSPDGRELWLVQPSERVLWRYGLP